MCKEKELCCTFYRAQVHLELCCIEYTSMEEPHVSTCHSIRMTCVSKKYRSLTMTQRYSPFHKECPACIRQSHARQAALCLSD